jgi:ketosteroid isomerase-like protein
MSAADTKTIIEQAFKAWAARDMPALLALVDERIEQEVRIAGTATAVSPAAVGKDAVAARWQAIQQVFDFATVTVDGIEATDTSARAATHLVYIHRATGERLEGRGHAEFALDGGRITRMVEYYDLEALTAFGRLMAAG